MLSPLGNRDLVALYTPSTGLLFQQQQYSEGVGLIVQALCKHIIKDNSDLKEKNYRLNRQGRQ